MKVLWLASWYPNPYEPFNGDFIQRHARAVAAYMPIHVIHVLQNGAPAHHEVVEHNTKDLSEHFYAFNFKQTGVRWLDKIWYNIRYHSFYKKVLEAYVNAHGKPDLVHVHVPVKAGLMALYLLRKYKIPYVVSEQSSHHEPSSPDYFFKRSKYYQNNCRRIFGNAVAVTNVSETIGKRLKQLFAIKKYTTIHNLVDTGLFYYTETQSHHKLRFMHASALGEQKNPTGLLKALASLKEKNQQWECVICGPYKEDLVSLIEVHGLQKFVHFTGEVSYNTVADYMHQSDVFVLFSNHENFPCVIVEALCCGLPVVSSVAGGIAEAVNATNGILVNAGDVTALENAMLQMINTYENYNRKQISKRAVELYNSKFIGGKFIELYKNIVS